MSEIRKHYFLDEYCIIAGERSKRPSDFVLKPEKAKVIQCPFCGGNESLTPKATAVYRNGQVLTDTDHERVTGWQVRCIPNLYPAVGPESSHPAPVIMGKGWQVHKGYGFHEVIVETPEHRNILSTFTSKEITLLMQVYKDRVLFYRSQKGIVYVSLFKNSGEAGGASLEHTHTQLIALPVIPSILKREQEVIHNINYCPYCEIVKIESTSPRLIIKNEYWAAFAPFYSQSPFEVWIMPFEHISHIGECSDIMLEFLGSILKEIMIRYSEVLYDPPYNYMFFQDSGKYHLNLRIKPVLSIIAGFEKNTDIYINTVAPEQAASFLRQDSPI
jgi:UDPglucose--hexose-1-phosphate uridylyltransferase